MLASAYRMLTDLGAPVINRYLRRRLAQGKEDAARFPERLGIASHPRPHGRLVWCHAASVGEAASFLALIEKLRENYTETQILITTGTVTSAKMLAGRLPLGAVHQYVPVDRLPYVRAFLDHWKPDLALWIESELWPNMLSEVRARNIPAALLNGTMSEKSFRNWSRVQGWAREILGAFRLCLTQTEEDRARFTALGARDVKCFGNLKYAGKPLPYDEAALAQMKATIGKRPVWLMASTHPGEEEVAVAVHRKLREKFPELLTLIVPRHARRGDEIALKLTFLGCVFVQRSKDQAPRPETEIYLADTMGELGLFYRLSPITVMGGTFVPVGGHNLVEPAQLGSAIIFGPYMHTVSEVAGEFAANHAAIRLNGENEIPGAIEKLLTSPEARERMAAAARALAEQKRHVLDEVLEALGPWLGPKSGNRDQGQDKVMCA